MNRSLSPSIAVAAKDLRSELRTRYGLTTLGLSVVTTVALVVFAAGEEPLSRPLSAAIVWIAMVTTAMAGLGRTFISEEERGTSVFLRLTAPSLAVYFGKLGVNLALCTLANVATALLFFLFVPAIGAGNIISYSAVVLTGSLGISASATIISAIVAKAGGRNALLPVLAFPLLVPVLLPGVNATIAAMAGFSIGEIIGDLVVVTSYSGILIVVSVLVFDVLWED